MGQAQHPGEQQHHEADGELAAAVQGQGDDPGEPRGRGRIAQNTAPTVMTANTASTALAAPGLRPLNSRAIATIGPNSPTDPNAITTDPNLPSSRPESRRIGSTAPGPYW